MANYLQATGSNKISSVLANVRTALNTGETPVNTGDTIIKINKGTGAVTFGKDNTPLPPDHRFAVPVECVKHGYMTWDTAKKNFTDRRMVLMGEQPEIPKPPGGYAEFGKDGPRKCIEVRLASIDEPGFNPVFPSMSVSNDIRVNNLLAAAADHEATQAHARGFVYPVVHVGSGSYPHSVWGDVWHVEFDIVDWLHLDCETLLSSGKPGKALPQQTPQPDDEMPWDEEDPEAA